MIEKTRKKRASIVRLWKKTVMKAGGSPLIDSDLWRFTRHSEDSLEFAFGRVAKEFKAGNIRGSVSKYAGGILRDQVREKTLHAIPVRVLFDKARYLDDAMYERFLKYVSSPDADGCTLWTGSATRKGDRPDGEREYGKFKIDGRPIGAHVFAFWYAHGRMLPTKGQDIEVGHTCYKKPLCVNAGHLYATTHAANLATREWASKAAEHNDGLLIEGTQNTLRDSLTDSLITHAQDSVQDHASKVKDTLITSDTTVGDSASMSRDNKTLIQRGRFLEHVPLAPDSVVQHTEKESPYAEI
jgi:hypothetical protein